MACVAAGRADTLTLRSGQVVQGTYQGGTARTVRMQIEDSVKTYDVTDIASLQFTPPAPAAATAPTPEKTRKAAAAPVVQR